MVLQLRSISSLLPSSGHVLEDGDPCHLPDDDGSTPDSGVKCSDASEWLESHLRLNEFLYPPCPLSSTSSFTSVAPLSSPRPSLQGGDATPDRDIVAEREAGEAACMQHSSPVRRVVPLSSPQSREPTVVHGSGSTVFIVLTADETEEAGAGLQNPSKLHSASSDMSATSPSGLSSMGSEDDLLDALKVQQQSHSSSYPGCARSILSSALVHGCTRMTIYLLGAYSTLTVSSCVDCDIVVGAVSGSVVMSACERVNITVACRKMILWSCHDCEIKIATLTPTILTGDCRGLVFGKRYYVAVTFSLMRVLP